MAVMYFLLSIFLLLVSKRRYGYYFTPLGVYSVLWGIALIGLYSNPFNCFQPYPKTTIIFFLSFLSYVSGCLISPIHFSLLNKNSKLTDTIVGTNISLDKRNGISQPFFIHNIPSIIYIQLMTYFGFIIMLFYLYSTIRYYGWENLFIESVQIRMDYVMSENLIMSKRALEFSFWFGLPIVYTAAVLNLVIWVGSNKIRWYGFLPLGSALAFDMATRGRTHTLNMIVFYATAYLLWLQLGNRLFWKKTLIKKKNFVLVFLALSFAFLIMWHIGQSRHPDWNENNLIPLFNKIYVPFSIVHASAYLVTPLAAFDVVFNFPGQHRLWFGRNTLRALERIFTRYLHINIFDDLPISTTEYSIPVDIGWMGAPNTYSYLRYLWDDWGYIGLILGPFLLGYITSSLYYDIRIRFSCRKFSMFLIFMNVVILSPTILNFVNASIMWSIPLIWLSFCLPQIRINKILR